MGAPEAKGRNIALAVTPGLDDDAAGITAAQAHHHRIIAAHSGENSIQQHFLLTVFEGTSFTGGAAYHQAVNTLGDEVVCQTLDCVEIDLPLPERRNQGHP